jgi:allantoinase
LICVTHIREKEAVSQLMHIAKETVSGGAAEGTHIHIVHLSDSEDSLALIKVIS